MDFAKIISWVLARLKEPSTWASIAATGLLGFLGLDASEASPLWQAIVMVGTAIATLLGVVLSEKPATPPQ